MRQWRVGTFSMGAMLLVFGICLLWGAVNGYSIVSYVLQWWPLTLVLLGVEVILYTYLRKTERLTYDLMSIALIFVLGVGSFGLYALQSVGVVEAAQRALTQSVYEVELDGETLPNDAAIRKVVIDNPGDTRLTIHNVKDTPGKIAGHLQVRAASRGEAELQRGFDIATIAEQGEQLFIHVKKPETVPAFGPSGESESVELFIPSTWSVEVQNGYRPLSIRTLDPQGNWTVQSDGEVDVTLAGQGAVAVEARTRGERNLGGNVQWTVEPLQTKKPRNGTADGRADAAPSAPSGVPGELAPASPATPTPPDVDRIDGELRGHYHRGTGGVSMFIESRMIRVTDSSGNPA
ncbi:MAG: hypothetical protein K0R75_2816 [Paenibacillaceae bacterium]|nr:hypothetical protein [Paenibacillaceae bacterium]